MRREHLPTLIPNDMVYRPLRAELLFAVHDVDPETGERAVQHFSGERVPFWFLPRTRGSRFATLGLACENDLGRERDHLFHEMLRAEVAPQSLVRPTGGIGALDEHGREVVWDLGRRCPPDSDVFWFDGHAVGLDVAKKDEFVLGRDVLDEEARALVEPRVVLAVTDRHAAHRDVGKYRLVFTIGAEAGRIKKKDRWLVSSDMRVFRRAC